MQTGHQFGTSKRRLFIVKTLHAAAVFPFENRPINRPANYATAELSWPKKRVCDSQVRTKRRRGGRREEERTTEAEVRSEWRTVTKHCAVFTGFFAPINRESLAVSAADRLHGGKDRVEPRTWSFHRERTRSWDRSTRRADIVAARARARAFRQFARITERLRGGASGASHLSATIVSALVHRYVTSTLFRFVIFVFRPIVACQLSPTVPFPTPGSPGTVCFYAPLAA